MYNHIPIVLATLTAIFSGIYYFANTIKSADFNYQSIIIYTLLLSALFAALSSLFLFSSMLYTSMLSMPLPKIVDEVSKRSNFSDEEKLEGIYLHYADCLDQNSAKIENKYKQLNLSQLMAFLSLLFLAVTALVQFLRVHGFI